MTLVEPQRFLKDLEQQLPLLSPQQQMTFGTMCCERHFSEYLRFSAEQDWGDPNALRLAIDLAWTIVLDDKKVNQDELKTLLEQCIEATPDSDDFPTVVSDYAQDAAIMICHLVKFLEERNPGSVVQIASRARDLVDARIQLERKFNPADPELEMKIASDQAMVSEIATQKSDLRKVSNIKESRELARLRYSI
jgi:uncharacterized protein YjaG (DUF416 family)